MMGGPPGAPGFLERAADFVASGGRHMQAAGAAIAPASPQVGAALLAIGGGMTTAGGYLGAMLLRRRMGRVPAAIAAALASPPTPSTPPGATPQVSTATAPTSTADAARVDTVQPQAGYAELVSPKAKRKRARRRGAAPAPFSARIAPAGGQQTSGRAAA